MDGHGLYLQFSKTWDRVAMEEAGRGWTRLDEVG